MVIKDFLKNKIFTNKYKKEINLVHFFSLQLYRKNVKDATFI